MKQVEGEWRRRLFIVGLIKKINPKVHLSPFPPVTPSYTSSLLLSYPNIVSDKVAGVTPDQRRLIWIWKKHFPLPHNTITITLLTLLILLKLQTRKNSTSQVISLLSRGLLTEDHPNSFELVPLHLRLFIFHSNFFIWSQFDPRTFLFTAITIKGGRI